MMKRCTVRTVFSVAAPLGCPLNVGGGLNKQAADASPCCTPEVTPQFFQMHQALDVPRQGVGSGVPDGIAPETLHMEVNSLNGCCKQKPDS